MCCVGKKLCTAAVFFICCQGDCSGFEMLLWFLSSTWDFHPETLCFPVPLNGGTKVGGKVGFGFIGFLTLFLNN